MLQLNKGYNSLEVLFFFFFFFFLGGGWGVFFVLGGGAGRGRATLCGGGVAWFGVEQYPGLLGVRFLWVDVLIRLFL